MEQKTTYISDNGVIFDSRETCVKYEKYFKRWALLREHIKQSAQLNSIDEWMGEEEEIHDRPIDFIKKMEALMQFSALVYCNYCDDPSDPIVPF